MNNLPSKKFIHTVSAIIIVLILIYLASYVDKKSNGNTKIDNNNEIAFNSFTETDSDNDGLKDWEEDLWGTDQNNPDSDGDGTLDGDEVNDSRDPTVAGPDDVIDTTKKLSGLTSLNEQDNNLSKTDLLSRELFKSVLVMQKSGNIDKQSINDVSSYFIQEILKEGADTSINYTYNDLKIADTDDKEAMKIYGNEIGLIITKYYYMTRNRTELDIIRNMLNNKYSKDTEKITEFDEFIKYYEDASLELLDLTVPESIAELHLETINTLNSIAESLRTTQLFYSDPLVGVSGIIKYQKEAAKLTGFSQHLQVYFAKNRIKFDRDEPGNILLIN